MPADQPTPSIGRIVIYRNRDGVDMPAIVTEVRDTPDGTDVHLHPFPPPGAAADVLSHQWGVAQFDGELEPNDPDEHRARQRWRWPERAA